MLKHPMASLKYLAALSIPLTAFIGISEGGAWTFLTPVYAFVLIPILEILLPQDASNLPPDTRENAAHNRAYDWMLYANVPIVYGLLWLVGSSVNPGVAPGWEHLGIALSLGIALGTNGINVGHELGHRQGSPERFLGKLLLLPSFYMHFYVEHNYGHHLNAATPEDPATAKYNQSVYGFWLTTVVGQYRSAWRIQADLLRRAGRGFFSVYNDMFWYLVITSAYLCLLYYLFGATGLVLLTASGIIGFLLLETVNYIEHYGLLRQKLPSGRYERVREIHSWNSNHIVGRVVLYELTRHSDHHYKSSKKYQVLDYHEQSPNLPFGYPTSMVLALVPPLWFRIMNPRIPAAMKPA
jgi:alkane 1-monooxygenase